MESWHDGRLSLFSAYAPNDERLVTAANTGATRSSDKLSCMQTILMITVCSSKGHYLRHT